METLEKYLKTRIFFSLSFSRVHLNSRNNTRVHPFKKKNTTIVVRTSFRRVHTGRQMVLRVVIVVAGYGGAKMRGGGVSAVDELHGQVPQHLHDQEVTATATRHHVSAARIETQGDQSHVGEAPRLLHRQLGYHRRFMGKFFCSNFRS